MSAVDKSFSSKSALTSIDPPAHKGSPGSHTGGSKLSDWEYRPRIRDLSRSLDHEEREYPDAAAELRSLQELVERYHRRLMDLVDEPYTPGLLDRVKAVVRQMDVSLPKSPLVMTTASSGLSGSSYEALRKSLQDTQKRYNSLNTDMERQTHDNGQLLSTLAATKDANKRLLEQIRTQTEDIAQLTQMRLQDEERIEQLQSKLQAEERSWRSETQRRIAQMRDHAEERYTALQSRTSDKMHSMKRKLDLVRSECMGLKNQHGEQRSQIKRLAEEFQHKLRSVSRDVLVEVEAHQREATTEKAQMQDLLRESDAKLAQEKEHRQKEVSSLTHRFSLCSGDKEELSTKLARETSSLHAHIESLQKSLAADRESYQDDRKGLEQKLDEATRLSNNLETNLQSAKRELAQMEHRVQALELDINSKDVQVSSLHQQGREKNESLAASAAEIDFLKKQLEEQRKRGLELNERELTTARSEGEERVAHVRGQLNAEMQLLRKQLRALEDEGSSRQTELERVQQRCEGLKQAKASLERDVALWKQQLESLSEAKREVERDYTAARDQWASDTMTLQESLDHVQQRRDILERDYERVSEEFALFKARSSTKEAHSATKIQELQRALEDCHSRLDEAKTSLTESSDALTRARSEAAESKRLLSDTQYTTDRQVETLRREYHEERTRLEEQISSERNQTHEIRDQYDRWKQAHEQALRQLQEESEAKVATLERERSRWEERYRSETTDAQRHASSSSKKCEELEQELLRVRQLLEASESNLELLKGAKDSDDREFSTLKGTLLEERRGLASQLESAKRREASLAQQLESVTGRFESERRRLTLEIQEAREQAAHEVHAARADAERITKDYESQLSHIESRYHETIEHEKVKLDNIVRENEQLKRFIQEHRNAAQGLTSLHNQLESHIKRVQTQTDEMRSGLSHSSGSPKRDSPSRELRFTPAARH